MPIQGRYGGYSDAIIHVQTMERVKSASSAGGQGAGRR